MHAALAMKSEEELEILLAFKSSDRVRETPPASPSHICGQRYDTDEDTSEPNKNVTMEAFREVISASLKTSAHKTGTCRARQPLRPIANGIGVEVHSGLRIRNTLVTSATLSNRLSAIRFVRLQAIRRHGEYCQYHATAIRQKFKSRRGELSGGNLATGFTSPNKFTGSHGMREVSDCIAENKPQKPVKHMTSKDLQKILSNAEKVTTKYQSQGVRFLASIADGSRENPEPMHDSNWQSEEQHGIMQKRACLDKSIGVSLLQKEDKHRTKEKLVDRAGLIELDLEGPDGGFDDAMAEAINIFQKVNHCNIVANVNPCVAYVKVKR